LAVISNSASTVRNSAATILKSVLKAQYARKEIPVGAKTLTIPWHPEEGKNLFFILIPETYWQAHKDEWFAHEDDSPASIEVTLHKEADINDTFQKTYPFRVDIERFRDNEPVALRHGRGNVRWAVVDPTHTSATIPDLLRTRLRIWRISCI
jgi:hypothetical protein